MAFDGIIFDLDGTLIDSSAGILAGFRGAFDAVGMEVKHPITEHIIGPPLMETLALLAGTDDVTVLHPLADAFMVYYDTEGYRSTTLFPGVESLLARLAALQIPLFIATNKRAIPTRRIVDHLGLAQYFAAVYALDSFSPKLANKSQLLARIALAHHLPAAATLYVGDRREDEKAASNNGMPFAMALWGYHVEAAENMPAHWQLLTSPEALWLPELVKRH